MIYIWEKSSDVHFDQPGLVLRYLIGRNVQFFICNLVSLSRQCFGHLLNGTFLFWTYLTILCRLADSWFIVHHRWILLTAVKARPHTINVYRARNQPYHPRLRTYKQLVTWMLLADRPQETAAVRKVPPADISFVS